jgi:TolB protein
LTDLTKGAYDPTWSPDGGEIAFASAGAHGRDVFVMRADGERMRMLAGTRGDDHSPDWSPDGTRIVFQSGEWTGEPVSHIWIADVASGDLTQLTTVGDGDGSPAWSPEGMHIVFLRYEGFGGQLEIADTDLYLMRADGTDQEPLLADEGPLDRPIDKSTNVGWGMRSPDNHFQGAPTWSPDGLHIAYTGGHCHCITIVNVAAREIERSIALDGFDDLSWDREGIMGTAETEEVV